MPPPVQAAYFRFEGMTCLSCGYALAGLRDNRCPECGESFTLSSRLAALQRRRQQTTQAIARGMGFVFLLVGGSFVASVFMFIFMTRAMGPPDAIFTAILAVIFMPTPQYILLGILLAALLPIPGVMIWRGILSGQPSRILTGFALIGAGWGALILLSSWLAFR